MQLIKTSRTYRLLANVVECVRCCVNNLTLDLVGPASVVPQATCGGRDIDILGHGEGLTIVKSLDSGEKVGILEEKVGKLDKKLSTVLWCLLPPGAVEGLAGSVYGNVYILLAGLLDLCNNLFCRGVDNVKGLSVNRLDELVVDEAVPRISSRKKTVELHESRQPEAGRVNLQTSGLLVLQLGSLELH